MMHVDVHMCVLILERAENEREWQRSEMWNVSIPSFYEEIYVTSLPALIYHALYA